MTFYHFNKLKEYFPYYISHLLIFSIYILEKLKLHDQTSIQHIFQDSGGNYLIVLNKRDFFLKAKVSENIIQLFVVYINNV